MYIRIHDLIISKLQPFVTYQVLQRHADRQDAICAVSHKGHALVTAAGSEITVWHYEESEGTTLYLENPTC